MTNTQKLIIKISIPVLIALLSIFVLSKMAVSPDHHAKTIASLDNKKTTVMELTAASTAASAAITVIPGDVATPIADKLADLSSYFLIVLCAIFLEKYLLTVTGYATFLILIPLACALYIAGIFLKNSVWHYLAAKAAIFGIAIVLIIPASVKISDIIESTYNVSIENTIAAAKEATDDINESTQSGGSDESILSSLFSKVKDGITGITQRVENILNNFIEALAVMLVTSCVIPIVVLLFFIWLIKLVLGVNIDLPKRN